MTGKKCPKGLYGTFCLVSLMVYYVVVASALVKSFFNSSYPYFQLQVGVIN